MANISHRPLQSSRLGGISLYSLPFLVKLYHYRAIEPIAERPSPVLHWELLRRLSTTFHLLQEHAHDSQTLLDRVGNVVSHACRRRSVPLKALIVDGQNVPSHKWNETSPVLKKLLEETGLFAVDTATSPPQGQDMSGFKPKFADYNVVVLNYYGDDWPEATQKAFVDYVAGGGGVVFYHFASAAFPKWKEYNQIAGVGGWGGRTEKAGPYLCWRDGKIVRATDPPGKAGFHGAPQIFQLVVRQPDHPITQGLPKVFMQAPDELYCRFRGPAENVEVLATS